MMTKVVCSLVLLLCAANVAAFSVRSSSPRSAVAATRTSPLFAPKDALTTTRLSASSVVAVNGGTAPKTLSPMASNLTRIGMISFILGMCIALPATLFPQQLLLRLGLISKLQSEKMALWTGQWCARWLLRLIPFCRIDVKPCIERDPEPSIWVCNHTSMLDVFLLLASDLRLRGRRKRPIKIVYWKQLESNPVTKLLFRQCGFIPVEMADNGQEDNDYDIGSFRLLLKETKRALSEGFDIGILPEGQLNPTPERGVMPVFSGAYTLAKMSKRPIRFMSMHGAHRLWHPTQDMICTSRQVKIRAFPPGQRMQSAEEFIDTFSHVVGHFGQTGQDPPDLSSWLNGSKWAALQQDKKSPSVSP